MQTINPNQARQRIHALREHIRSLQAEYHDHAGLRHSRQIVKQKLSHYLEQAEAQGRQALTTALERASVGQVLSPFMLKGTAAVSDAPGVAPFALDLSGVLVALLGADKLKPLLHSLCETIPEGLDEKTRSQRIKQIQMELDKAEQEEEALICELEAQGQAVTRRPDARPEIVLALAI